VWGVDKTLDIQVFLSSKYLKPINAGERLGNSRPIFSPNKEAQEIDKVENEGSRGNMEILIWKD
jgi:hypothetical protein